MKGAFVASLSQEHGVIRGEPGFVERISVGVVVYILPIHSCLTVNLLREYRSLEGGNDFLLPIAGGAGMRGKFEITKVGRS